MASGLQAAQEKQLKEVGRSEELKAQQAAQAVAEDAIAAIEATTISPTDLFATVEEKVTAVTSQVDLADGCNTDFSPNLVSLVSMYMSAITNPTGAVLSGLQLLNNTLDIKPPGFGLPEIDLDLGLPNISLPSLDFDISLGGGFDVNSMLKGAANLFAIPPIGNCGTLLPDIGEGASKIAGELETGLKEGESGGFVNPGRHLGNKFIKEEFDKLGNPIQVVITKGGPAVIAQSAPRTQAKPATLGTFEPPGYAGGGLQDNTSKPPVYGATEEILAKIKGEVEDPIFAELVNAKPNKFVNNRLQANKNTDVKAFANGTAYVEQGGLKIAVIKENDGAYIKKNDTDGVQRIGIPEGDGPPRNDIDIEIILNPDNE